MAPTRGPYSSSQDFQHAVAIQLAGLQHVLVQEHERRVAGHERSLKDVLDTVRQENEELRKELARVSPVAAQKVTMSELQPKVAPRAGQDDEPSRIPSSSQPMTQVLGPPLDEHVASPSVFQRTAGGHDSSTAFRRVQDAPALPHVQPDDDALHPEDAKDTNACLREIARLNGDSRGNEVLLWTADLLSKELLNSRELSGPHLLGAESGACANGAVVECKLFMPTEQSLHGDQDAGAGPRHASVMQKPESSEALVSTQLMDKTLIALSLELPRVEPSISRKEAATSVGQDASAPVLSPDHADSKLDEPTSELADACPSTSAAARSLARALDSAEEPSSGLGDASGGPPVAAVVLSSACALKSSTGDGSSGCAHTKMGVPTLPSTASASALDSLIDDAPGTAIGDRPNSRSADHPSGASPPAAMGSECGVVGSPVGCTTTAIDAKCAAETPGYARKPPADETVVAVLKESLACADGLASCADAAASAATSTCVSEFAKDTRTAEAPASFALAPPALRIPFLPALAFVEKLPLEQAGSFPGSILRPPQSSSPSAASSEVGPPSGSILRPPPSSSPSAASSEVGPQSGSILRPPLSSSPSAASSEVGPPSAGASSLSARAPAVAALRSMWYTEGVIDRDARALAPLTAEKLPGGMQAVLCRATAPPPPPPRTGVAQGTSIVQELRRARLATSRNRDRRGPACC